jgi:hypothetical protein
MSTSPVSSSSLSNQIQQYFKTRQSDLQQLGQALSSGNLAAAQSEFSTITTLGQSGPFSSGNAFANPTRESDFNAVGSALQSGNLQGAQQAFAQLQSTFRRGGNGGQPEPISPPVSTSTPPATAANPNSVGPEIVINLSGASGNSGSAGGSSTSTSAGPEIVLNLGSNSGSTPEQLTIDIGAESSTGNEQISFSLGAQGSSNPQEVTVNLNANSNQEIVLNLSAPTASSTAANGSSLNVTA